MDGTAYPDARVRIPLGALNRHGLVAGAAGTGTTKTVQLIAEQFSGRGAPTPVAATGLRAPRSLTGPIEAAALRAVVDTSPLTARYRDAIERESAYEKLMARAPRPEAAPVEPLRDVQAAPLSGRVGGGVRLPGAPGGQPASAAPIRSREDSRIRP
ncbi:helicase HerA-like domain-containing protein [Kitasatospora sp. NPDC048286]|uniref:helicase HerA-like domain-containing protein n=1 Tax=Kitasatospora sp. NPDC048286 TaxID=3364047 RepID=UPI003715C0C3